MDILWILEAVVVLVFLPRADCRGRMIEPPQRSSLWRFYDSAPINYDDHSLNCGGYWRHMFVNRGRCGVCGDSWDTRRPRPNEAGGKYATGFIPRTYFAADRFIDVKLEVTSSIGGYFEFRLCPNNDVNKPVTQGCLDRGLLKIKGHGYRYYIPRFPYGLCRHQLKLKIPRNMACSQCVLQWKWHGSHYWGPCHYGLRYGFGYEFDDDDYYTGCGAQEEYYNCADIRIIGENTTPPTTLSPQEIETTAHTDANYEPQEPITKPDVTPKPETTGTALYTEPVKSTTTEHVTTRLPPILYTFFTMPSERSTEKTTISTTVETESTVRTQTPNTVTTPTTVTTTIPETESTARTQTPSTVTTPTTTTTPISTTVTTPTTVTTTIPETESTARTQTPSTVTTPTTTTTPDLTTVTTPTTVTTTIPETESTARTQTPSTVTTPTTVITTIPETESTTRTQTSTVTTPTTTITPETTTVFDFDYNVEDPIEV